MRHLIDSETSRPIPFLPSTKDEMEMLAWVAMVQLILSGRGHYDADSDTLQLVQS